MLNFSRIIYNDSYCYIAAKALPFYNSHSIHFTFVYVGILYHTADNVVKFLHGCCLEHPLYGSLTPPNALPFILITKCIKYAL